MVQLYLAQDILEFKEYLVEHSNLVESLERVEFVEILIVVVEAITLRRASTLTASVSWTTYRPTDPTCPLSEPT